MVWVFTYIRKRPYLKMIWLAWQKEKESSWLRVIDLFDGPLPTEEGRSRLALCHVHCDIHNASHLFDLNIIWWRKGYNQLCKIAFLFNGFLKIFLRDQIFQSIAMQVTVRIIIPRKWAKNQYKMAPWHFWGSLLIMEAFLPSAITIGHIYKWKADLSAVVNQKMTASEF